MLVENNHLQKIMLKQYFDSVVYTVEYLEQYFLCH